jgi:hypothetical protein
MKRSFVETEANLRVFYRVSHNDAFTIPIAYNFVAFRLRLRSPLLKVLCDSCVFQRSTRKRSPFPTTSILINVAQHLYSNQRAPCTDHDVHGEVPGIA